MSKDSKKHDETHRQENEKKKAEQNNEIKPDEELNDKSDVNDAGKDEETIQEEANEAKKIDGEIKALRELNENLEKEVVELKDKLLRRVAEFDNYKRRVENEQTNLLKYAAEGFIIKIIPIFDDLNRSLTHTKDDSNNNAIKDGLQMVLAKFSKILEEQGIKKIEAVGQPFDVNFHEALMQRTVEDTPPHVVLDEIEPGYIYKDKVIKHSKVIVSDENSGSLLK